jgi:F-type H+-transporting ATPase subunit delta
MKPKKKFRRVARQLFQLTLVDGRVADDRARQVAARLKGGTERGSLPVLSEFLRLVRIDRALHTALIESAQPLTDDVRRDVEAQLAKAHGGDLGISVAINPALIGGMRITVGSSVYDGSVRGRLRALEQQF